MVRRTSTISPQSSNLLRERLLTFLAYPAIGPLGEAGMRGRGVACVDVGLIRWDSRDFGVAIASGHRAEPIIEIEYAGLKFRYSGYLDLANG